MAINFFNEDIDFILKNKNQKKNWLKKIIEFYNLKVGDISFIFCSEEVILRINREYLNHNYFTDIITFPYTEKNILSADIYISIPTVKSNAQIYSQTFIAELNRVIVHGVLHLVGFSDASETEKELMRDKENYWVEILDKSI